MLLYKSYFVIVASFRHYVKKHFATIFRLREFIILYPATIFKFSVFTYEKNGKKMENPVFSRT
ncbi:hypothetical protein DWY63_11985 [Blautia sp. AF26-2]|nr:hypothetical protein DWY63_11985 [Blautia sp. AF26-2]